MYVNEEIEGNPHLIEKPGIYTYLSYGSEAVTMQAKEIEAYLAELGQELQTLGVGQPIRILLIGGAFMLTQARSRRTTEDIDFVLKDEEEASAGQIPRVFKAAIRAVAARHDLPGNWINDMAGDFIHNTGPLPEGKLWRRFGQLEIFVPQKEYVLALKLLAGRPKDKPDIEDLCRQLKVRTREQAQRIVDRYVPDTRLQQVYGLERTLTIFF